MEELCAVLYWPGVVPDQLPPSLTSTLSGLVSQKRLLSERALLVRYNRHSNFLDRLRSSLPPSSGETVVSSPLSSDRAVCLVRVEGMVCQSCVSVIQSSLLSMAGVHGVSVSLAGKEAFVEFEKSFKSANELVTDIEDLGFEAAVISTISEPDLATECGGGEGESGEGAVSGEGVGGEGVSSEGAGGDLCVVIGVEGMVCQSCVSNIQTNIVEAEGVKFISVSLEDKTATICYEPYLTSPSSLCDAIEELGFEATVTSATTSEPFPQETDSRSVGGKGLKQTKKSCVTSGRAVVGEGVGEGRGRRRCRVGIGGMTCHSCVSLVESALQDLRGVVNVTVDLATEEGVVEYDEGLVGVGEICSAIQDTGFEVTHTSGERTVYRSMVCVGGCGVGIKYCMVEQQAL